MLAILRAKSLNRLLDGIRLEIERDSESWYVGLQASWLSNINKIEGHSGLDMGNFWDCKDSMPA